jgi:hypothetical protein
MCAIERFRFAAAVAFLMLRRAAALWLDDAVMAPLGDCVYRFLLHSLELFARAETEQIVVRIGASDRPARSRGILRIGNPAAAVSASWPPNDRS